MLLLWKDDDLPHDNARRIMDAFMRLNPQKLVAEVTKENMDVLLEHLESCASIARARKRADAQAYVRTASTKALGDQSLALHVFSFMQPQSLVEAGLASKCWNTWTKSGGIWWPLVAARWPGLQALEVNHSTGNAKSLFWRRHALDTFGHNFEYDEHVHFNNFNREVHKSIPHTSGLVPNVAVLAEMSWNGNVVLNHLCAVNAYSEAEYWCMDIVIPEHLRGVPATDIASWMGVEWHYPKLKQFSLSLTVVFENSVFTPLLNVVSAKGLELEDEDIISVHRAHFLLPRKLRGEFFDAEEHGVFQECHLLDLTFMEEDEEGEFDEGEGPLVSIGTIRLQYGLTSDDDATLDPERVLRLWREYAD